MSESPSPLKSPAPITSQLGPGLAPALPPPTTSLPFVPPTAADHARPTRLPDRGLATVVLPPDIGMPIEIEVGRRRQDCRTHGVGAGIAAKGGPTDVIGPGCGRGENQPRIVTRPAVVVLSQ